MSENGKKLQKNYNEMNEFKHVLERVENFFEVVGQNVKMIYKKGFSTSKTKQCMKLNQ